jgi:magnesium transporter
MAEREYERAAGQRVENGTDDKTQEHNADPALPAIDEEGTITPVFVEAITASIENEDAERVHELASDLHESDLAALIEALSAEDRPKLIEIMGADFDFAALTEVDVNIRDEILEELPASTVAEGMRDLEADDALVLLEDLDEQDQQEILEALPPIDRAALQRSLDYPEASAGRLMQTTLVTAPLFWTAAQMVDYLRATSEEELPDAFFEVFIVDPGHRLLGNVFLDVLLRANGDRKLEELMDADRRRVLVTEDRGEVARLFQRYNFVSLPVVDSAERLVGVITIDDIVDVISDEADEEVKALGGVSVSETLSDNVWWTTKSRFLWLFVNLITAFIASAVLGLFEGQLQRMVALAVLAPIVASQGGNAATQTMTVAVRALATRELSRFNRLRIIGREMLVGALNGAIFGLLTGAVAAIWFGVAGLGVVIALAMLTNLVAGALGGILVPVVLDRADVDPAVSSGAFVTTVTDVVGYSSFLGIATLWFGLT